VEGSTESYRQLKLPFGGPEQELGVKPRGPEPVPSDAAAPPPEEPGASDAALLEQVLDRENLLAALKRVKANRGAPGIDGMTVNQLPEYLKEHWPAVREALLAGTYRPQAVRRVEIPKPGGGVRLLGIPTALDRLIQQALAQVMSQLFDPSFSDSSYGFRPKRSAHQAVRKAQAFIREGRRYVVDMDLAQFFDRVNHDILMARVARKVKDKRVLKLLRAYLEAGVMLNGVCVKSEEGTPQGGPISPLLANILLDDLDKALEERGHAFCRYADDCNIYVRSRRAGERVKESVTRFLTERLKLQVNEAKSAVDRPWKRKFLGFSFTNRKENPQLRVAAPSLTRAKSRLRQLTWRWKGQSLDRTLADLNAFLRGWGNYFAHTDTFRAQRDLDEWVRRRLRALLWHQWKKPSARARNLMARGIPREQAWQWAQSGRKPWRMSGSAPLQRTLDNTYWRAQGLVSLVELQRVRSSR
jgi:group II intron reverse transcriptase/maturase